MMNFKKVLIAVQILRFIVGINLMSDDPSRQSSCVDPKSESPSSPKKRSRAVYHYIKSSNSKVKIWFHNSFFFVVVIFWIIYIRFSERTNRASLISSDGHHSRNVYKENLESHNFSNWITCTNLISFFVNFQEFFWKWEESCESRQPYWQRGTPISNCVIL